MKTNRILLAIFFVIFVISTVLLFIELRQTNRELDALYRWAENHRAWVIKEGIDEGWGDPVTQPECVPGQEACP